MPLLQEIRICEGVKVGLWHLTETNQTLLELLNPSPEDLETIHSFKHPDRQKQWLGVRLLVKHLTGQKDGKITYDENGKPYLPSGGLNISISHSGVYAAIAWSSRHKVGIDIEQISDRINKVKERFLREDELASLPVPCLLEQLYVCWGGKEALFKISGNPGLDFRTDILIHPFDYLCNPKRTCQATLFREGSVTQHTFHYRDIGGWMLVVAY